MPGKRCWVCDADTSRPEAMELVPHAGEHVRYGAFLPSVPVMRRVGDYVHCACRLVNALLGRLCGEGIPALKRDVEAFLKELTKPPGAAALPPAAHH